MRRAVEILVGELKGCRGHVVNTFDDGAIVSVLIDLQSLPDDSPHLEDEDIVCALAYQATDVRPVTENTCEPGGVK